MIKYKTGGYNELIQKITIDRETETSVFFKGRIERKITNYHCYFDTFDEAKNYLIKEKEKEIEWAQIVLDRGKKELLEINNLKEG